MRHPGRPAEMSLGDAGRIPPAALMALAWREARYVLLHPVLWVGVLLSAAWLFTADKQLLPVLHRDVIRELRGLVPAMAGTLLTASLVASRGRREGLENLQGSLPVRSWMVTTAQLAAISAAALPATTLLAADMLLLRFAWDGSWAPSPMDAAVWPIAVVAAGWLGMLIERWTRSTMAAFLGVAGVTGIVLLIEDPRGTSTFVDAWRSLGFWVPLEVSTPEFTVRRPGMHVAYLVAGAALIGILAIVRDRRTRPVLVWVMIATVGTVGTAWAQLRPITPEETARVASVVLHPASVHQCEQTSRARYCSYPAFAAWRTEWRAVIEPIVSAVPQHLADQRLEVAQRPIQDLQRRPHPRWAVGHASTFAETIRAWRRDEVLSVDRTWSRPPFQGSAEFDALAVPAAVRVAGIRSPGTPAPSPTFESCNTMGEARTVLALWLAGSATNGTEMRYRELHSHTRLTDLDLGDVYRGEGGLGDYGTGLTPSTLDDRWTVEWPRLEAEIALSLLDRPRLDVLRTVQAHWAELVDPTTSTAEAIRIFDVDVPTDFLPLLQVEVGTRCS